MNLSNIFQRRKALKTEAIRPVRSQYLDLVRELAEGNEVDEDRLFACLDALQIDESQLSKDVATQQERLSLAEQVAIRAAAQNEIHRLTSEQQKLKSEHEAFLAKWQPKAKAVNDALKAAEQDSLTYMMAEDRLLRTVLDPEILEQQADLDSRRMELATEIREIQEQARQGENLISTARSGVEAAMQRIQMTKGPHYKHKAGEETRLEKELEDERQTYDRTRARYQPLFDRHAELKRQMQAMETEQRALNKLKLKP